MKYSQWTGDLKRSHQALDALALIAESGGVTVTELGKTLSVPPQTASKLLKLLSALNQAGDRLVQGDRFGGEAIVYSTTSLGRDVLNMLSPIAPLFSADWKEWKAEERAGNAEVISA